MRRVDSDLQSHHFLKASLSFSPACLTLPFTWSALPSARSLLLPLTLPAVSFSFPLACWAVFFALSVVAMVGLLVLGCEKRDEPSLVGLHRGSPCSLSGARPWPQRSVDLVAGCGEMAWR